MSLHIPYLRTIVTSAAAVLMAVVTITFDVWPKLGWTTPMAHQQDLAEVEARMASDKQDILDAIEQLGRQETERHEEWLCDEIVEELNELLARQDQGDESARTRERVRQLREGYNSYACERFE